MNRSTTVKSNFRKWWNTPALKTKFMVCYCNEICKFMSEGRCTFDPLDHTGQCKSTGGYLQRPGVGFFRSGAGQNAIPTVIIMFDIGKIWPSIYYSFHGLFGKSITSLKQEVVFCYFQE